MKLNKKVLITGSLGLIGFDTALFFLKQGFEVLGIDNNLRSKIFNIKTKYDFKLKLLKEKFAQYHHFNFDIRDAKRVSEFFKQEKEFYAIIHTAAQTSHDWSKLDPFLDFTVNANGTLNLLEAFRRYSPSSVFIFTSTNKVYGDLVNKFSFKELKTRFDLEKTDLNFNGIKENFPIDNSTHSLFGVSKASADLLVQEYGKYFKLKTGIFRLGVVTGSGQSASLYQGFFSFILDSIIRKKSLRIIGYKGKQVRDVINSVDVAKAFYYYCRKANNGEVFNLGGGRENSVSLLELLDKASALTGKKVRPIFLKEARKGDHKWWISDNSKFSKTFPKWKISKSLDDIILEIYNSYVFGGIQNIRK